MSPIRMDVGSALVASRVLAALVKPPGWSEGVARLPEVAEKLGALADLTCRAEIP